MSPHIEQPVEFEKHARAILEESVLRVDGRVRSRLNQARHAAVAEASRRRSVFWRPLTLMPTTGAVAAAVLVAMVLWHRQSPMDAPIADVMHVTPTEDLDLLADGEGLDLMESDGSFYEWAVEQTQAAGNGETES